MTQTTIKLTPIEQAMTWEKMSGEQLSDTERQRILDGGDFSPPVSTTAEYRELVHIADAAGYLLRQIDEAADQDTIKRYAEALRAELKVWGWEG